MIVNQKKVFASFFLLRKKIHFNKKKFFSNCERLTLNTKKHMILVLISIN